METYKKIFMAILWVGIAIGSRADSSADLSVSKGEGESVVITDVELDTMNETRKKELETLFEKNLNIILVINFGQKREIPDDFNANKYDMLKKMNNLFIDSNDYINIGKNFLSGCSNLKTLGFKKVMRFGSGFLEGCPNLYGFMAERIVEIHDNFLEGFINLKQVFIQFAYNIGKNFLKDCSALEKLDFLGISSGFDECFLSGCKNLKDMTFPENLIRKLPNEIRTRQNEINITEVSGYNWESAEEKDTSVLLPVSSAKNFIDCNEITLIKLLKLIIDQLHDGTIDQKIKSAFTEVRIDYAGYEQSIKNPSTDQEFLVSFFQANPNVVEIIGANPEFYSIILKPYGGVTLNFDQIIPAGIHTSTDLLAEIIRDNPNFVLRVDLNKISGYFPEVSQQQSFKDLFRYIKKEECYYIDSQKTKGEKEEKYVSHDFSYNLFEEIVKRFHRIHLKGTSDLVGNLFKEFKHFREVDIADQIFTLDSFPKNDI